jgi:hypothetical protein
MIDLRNSRHVVRNGAGFWLRRTVFYDQVSAESPTLSMKSLLIGNSHRIVSKLPLHRITPKLQSVAAGDE